MRRNSTTTSLFQHPATVTDSVAIANATCNFLKDALGLEFIYNRSFGTEPNIYPTLALTDFQCEYDFLESTGPLEIEYQITPTYEIPRTHTPFGLLNRDLPPMYEIWTSILTYLYDVPVRTVGTTVEVLSTRVKSEIASASPYQLYTNLVTTVKPYTQFFQLKDLIISYVGTGGVPVKASDRRAVVNATCAFIINSLPAWGFDTSSMTVSNIDCKLKSHKSNGIPLVLTYDVEATVDVGPTLDDFTAYLENDDQDAFAFPIEIMFENRFFRNETLDEMNTFVNNAIGPNNPYYNYTYVEIEQFLDY
jgi:hypothetical protein